MNPIFYDQLPMALLQTEGKHLTFQNKKAKKVFPNLHKEESAVKFLEKKMPSSRGEIRLGTEKYVYTREEKEGMVLYTLEPLPSFPLDATQIDKLLYAFREGLTSISTASDAIAEGKELLPRLYSINASLAKLQRLTSNCQLAIDENVSLSLGTIDVVGLISQLTIEVNTLFPDKSIEFDTKESSVIALGNSHYFRKVLLGIITNGFQTSSLVKIRLQKNKTNLFIELCDSSPLSLERSAIDLLSGRSQGQIPKPKEGAGLSLLAIQKILKALDYQLWAETPDSGGFQLIISIPLPTKNEIDAAMNHPNAALQVFLDDDGGFSDLLLNLSPVLEDKYFSPEDLEN